MPTNLSCVGKSRWKQGGAGGGGGERASKVDGRNICARLKNR